MAQDVTIAGASYPDVPAVNLPKTGGGTAPFFDVSDTTATAADVASGKLFHDITGALTQGTASGGGGSNWTLLATQDVTVSTTSTTNTQVATIELTLSDYADPQTVLWVHIRDKAGRREGYFYGTDTIFFHWQLANDNYNSLSIRPAFLIRYTLDSIYNGSANAYGVYAHNLYYSSKTHEVRIYSRYSSSTTGTVNGTFKCDVYKLTMPSGMTLFETT